MRVVIQRVSRAKVTISGTVHGQIDKGLLILLGIEEADSIEDTRWLVKKILDLRIFNDESGKMNLSLKDIEGKILVVSQFTLHASTKKGNRPSFIQAAKPDFAEEMYLRFTDLICMFYDSKYLQTGKFGAMMDVELVNDGPVTILMDSKNKT